MTGALVDAFDRSVREDTVQLVTIIAEPGVGKSRLLNEFRETIDARPDIAWWRQGRCLPYGEGVTFWALSEMVKAQTGVLDTDSAADAERKLLETLREGRLKGDRRLQSLLEADSLLTRPGLAGEQVVLPRQGQQSKVPFEARSAQGHGVHRDIRPAGGPYSAQRCRVPCGACTQGTDAK